MSVLHPSLPLHFFPIALYSPLALPSSSLPLLPSMLSLSPETSAEPKKEKASEFGVCRGQEEGQGKKQLNSSQRSEQTEAHPGDPFLRWTRSRVLAYVSSRQSRADDGERTFSVIYLTATTFNSG